MVKKYGNSSATKIITKVIGSRFRIQDSELTTLNLEPITLDMKKVLTLDIDSKKFLLAE